MKKFAIKKHSIISGIYEGKIFVFSPSRISIFSKSGDLLLKFNVGERYISSFSFGGKVIIPGVKSLLISLADLSIERDHRYYRKGCNNFILRTECIRQRLRYEVLNLGFERVFSFEDNFICPVQILDDGTIIRYHSLDRSIIHNFLEEEKTSDYVYGFDSTIIRSSLRNNTITVGSRTLTSVTIYRHVIDGIFDVISPNYLYLDLKYGFQIPKEVEKYLLYSNYDKKFSTITTINSKEYIFGFGMDTIACISRDFSTIKKVYIPNLYTFCVDEGVIYYRECDDLSVRKTDTFFSMVWRGIEVFSNFGFCNYLKLLSSTF